MPIAAMARARAMRANAFPGFVTDDVMCYHSPNRRENAEAAAWYRGAYYFITRSSLCIGAIDGSGTGSDPVRRRQGDTGVRMSGADRVAPAWRCPPRRPRAGRRPRALSPSSRCPTRNPLADSPEHRPIRDAGRGGPGINGVLDPRGHGDGAHVSALTDEIGDHPVLLAL